MANDLESLIRKIKVRIRAEDPTVIDDAVKLTEQYPKESDTWDVLAYAYAREDHYAEAIAALTRAIEINPRKIALVLKRGEHGLTIGDYHRAIADFSQALILSDEQNVDWCRRALHFLRAEALIQVGKKVEALADLAHLPEDYESYTTDLRTKAELLALCADASTPDNDGRYNGPAELPDEENAFDTWQLPDSPNEDEAACARELGDAGLAKADATLLKWVPQRFGKVARILAEAIEADDFKVTDALVCVYLRRLIALADSGAIEGAGNLRRPRFSEVRLPADA